VNDELLLQIALRAMADREALPVLQDAILESGYTDFNVANLAVKLGNASTESVADNYGAAVAAYMLFIGWPTSWPLADQAHDGDILIFSGGRFRNAAVRRFVRGWEPTEADYNTAPLLGMVPKAENFAGPAVAKIDHARGIITMAPRSSEKETNDK